MQIKTSRFGAVQIQTTDLIQFPEGLLGFNDLRSFVLLDDPSDDIFAWVQSCENPGIAFPVLEPELFTDAYTVRLSKGDKESLGLAEGQSFRIFTIVTIPEDPTKMTANLKAPLVINVANRVGRQCVLQDNKLAICEPIFSTLQQRMVQSPQTKVKASPEDLGVVLPFIPPADMEHDPTKGSNA